MIYFRLEEWGGYLPRCTDDRLHLIEVIESTINILRISSSAAQLGVINVANEALQAWQNSEKLLKYTRELVADYNATMNPEPQSINKMLDGAPSPLTLTRRGKRPLATANESDESHSDDSYHYKSDGYSVPKKASFYAQTCSGQNPRPTPKATPEMIIPSPFITKNINENIAHTSKHSTPRERSLCMNHRIQLIDKAVNEGLLSISDNDAINTVASLYTKYINELAFWYVFDLSLKGSPHPHSIEVM